VTVPTSSYGGSRTLLVGCGRDRGQDGMRIAKAAGARDAPITADETSGGGGPRRRKASAPRLRHPREVAHDFLHLLERVAT